MDEAVSGGKPVFAAPGEDGERFTSLVASNNDHFLAGTTNGRVWKLKIRQRKIQWSEVFDVFPGAIPVRNVALTDENTLTAVSDEGVKIISLRRCRPAENCSQCLLEGAAPEEPACGWRADIGLCTPSNEATVDNLSECPSKSKVEESTTTETVFEPAEREVDEEEEEQVLQDPLLPADDFQIPFGVLEINSRAASAIAVSEQELSNEAISNVTCPECVCTCDVIPEPEDVEPLEKKDVKEEDILGVILDGEESLNKEASAKEEKHEENRVNSYLELVRSSGIPADTESLSGGGLWTSNGITLEEKGMIKVAFISFNHLLFSAAQTSFV